MAKYPKPNWRNKKHTEQSAMDNEHGLCLYVRVRHNPHGGRAYQYADHHERVGVRTG